MAQTQKPTKLGYAEIAKRMATAGDGSGSCVKSVVGLTGACTASEDSTFLNPGGATKLAANGFSLADADTVVTSKTAVDDDTVELDHVFTATDTQSVSGFAVENDDDDVVFAECCFDSAAACEKDDTLTVEMKQQFKLGA